MNAEIIVFVMVFLISLFIRFYLLLRYKWIGKDTFYHFIVAKKIKENGFPPEYIDQFVKPEKYDYPPGFHLFVSLFEEKKYQKLQFLSPVVDILTSIAIFGFCNTTFNFEVAIISTSLYLVTPFMLDNAYSFNPRSFANLFFVIAIFSSINSVIFNSLVWFSAAIIFSVLVLLLHRLTTQCLFFILVLFVPGMNSFIPGMILILSILSAIILTKGFYLKVLRGHFAFIEEFGRKILEKKNIDEQPSLFPDPKQYLFNMPVLLTLPLLVYYPLVFQGPLMFSLLIWALGLTVLSIIWVFGEGIRHMICSVPAFSILAALIVVAYQLYSIFFILVFVSGLFGLYKIFRMEKHPSISGIVSKDMLSAFEFIRTNKKKREILFCLPLDYTYNAAYFSDCIMLQSSGGFAEGLRFNQKLHKMINQGKIDEIIEKYSPNWVIILEKSKWVPDQNLFLNKQKYSIEFGEIKIIKLDTNCDTTRQSFFTA